MEMIVFLFRFIYFFEYNIYETIIIFFSLSFLFLLNSVKTIEREVDLFVTRLLSEFV